MKKIPTAFERVFVNGRVSSIQPVFTNPACEYAVLYGIPTLKIDGSCCALIGGELYKRYDAKRGKNIPVGAIPCQDEPDEITGHFPHWVKCENDNPADKWFFAALDNYNKSVMELYNIEKNGVLTLEAYGRHFNGNPYNMGYDTIYIHGSRCVPDIPRNFDGIRHFLFSHYIEGVVFWLNGEPVCKIKRSDFGFTWG